MSTFIVKPLEWGDLVAETPFGRYAIAVANGTTGRAWLQFVGGSVSTPFDTVEAAKAAAQADYEARIRSALVASTAVPEGFTTTDIDVLIGALFGWAAHLDAKQQSKDSALLRQAAEMIDALSFRPASTSAARLQDVLDALKPFAEAVDTYGDPGMGDMASVLNLVRNGDLVITGVSIGDLRRAKAVYDAVRSATTGTSMTETALVERVADDIEVAIRERRYGLYDYSDYPGDAPPHVVRDERTGEVLLRTIHKDEAATFYERICREYPARAAIAAAVGDLVGYINPSSHGAKSSVGEPLNFWCSPIRRGEFTQPVYAALPNGRAVPAAPAKRKQCPHKDASFHVPSKRCKFCTGCNAEIDACGWIVDARATDMQRELREAVEAMLKTMKAVRGSLVRLAWDENSLMIEEMDEAIAKAEPALRAVPTGGG